MWQVPAPRRSARSVYATCVGRVSNADLRNRLQNVEEEVEKANQIYVVAAVNGAIYTLDKTQFALSGVSTKEMIAVYESRMVKRTSVGRFIYDELMTAPEQGRCPACGHRDVSTLDHHLPKTVFPALAVDPWNLIPMCGECNRKKRNSVALNKDEEALHPYFDNVGDLQWLRATVVEGGPVAFRFYVDPPSSWDDSMKKRALLHFKTFQLGPLYSSQGSQEASSIKYHVTKLFDVAGVDDVRAFLSDQAETRRKASVNSWRTATYEALRASDWYCNGGFRA